MEKNKKLKRKENLFVIHRDEITQAYQRAVCETLIRHKKAGNYVVTSRDGKVVILKPDEIPM